MKNALALIAFAALTASASAVEFRTITSSSGSVAFPTDHLVEIVGIVARTAFINREDSVLTPRNEPELTIEFSNGSIVSNSLVTYSLSATTGASIDVQVLAVATNTSLKGSMFNGVSSMLVTGSAAVTVKLTAPSEINAVTPSAVLVLPENSTGNFDVIIEASDDLLTWSPFFSQTVNSATATRFFRTRVTKTPAPNP